MNHVYKTLFNRALGVWQSVSELAKSRGKSGGGSRVLPRKAALATLVTALTLATPAWAQSVTTGGQVIDNGNPVGGEVNQPHPWITGSLLIGRDADGTLDIQNGGRVESSVASAIGVNSTGNGSVIVDGNNSAWVIGNGGLTVGDQGSGKLVITGGGSVQDHGNQSVLGDSTDSNGFVLVDGAGSTLTLDGLVTVGRFGTGTLTITDGGNVSNITAVIGDVQNSDGTVTVDGENSTWTNGGYLYVGASGTGTLNISAGGTVSNLNTVIGDAKNSDGTATVDGENSTWTIVGGLYVGASGTGTLNISAGGSVSSDWSYIGYDADSDGTVTVDGENSAWTAGGQLVVAGGGSGSLFITNGGRVESGDGTQIGIGADSQGIAGVAGANSAWTMGDNLTVANDGDGALLIQNGGAVSNTGTATIGRNAGSVGVAGVDGLGATWMAGDRLEIGANGSGRLDITNNGLVRTGAVEIGIQGGGEGTLNLNRSGALNSSGVLETSGIAKGSGQASLNFNGGILRATEDNAGFISGFAAGDVTLGAGGATIDSNGFDIGASAVIGGADGVNTGLTKLGAGRLTLSGNNTYRGGTAINAGTLSVSAANNLGDTAGRLLSFNGGTLQSTASFTADWFIILNANGGTFEAAAGTELRLIGAITGISSVAGNNSLTKTDAGTLTLAAMNSYSGPTTINAGTLAITATGGITSDVTNHAAFINEGAINGALMQLAGTATNNGAISGAVTINGGTLAGGGSTGDLTIGNA
ncbi:MAG: autotransporter-associated beta strand repeat-containing protein, partial [Pseudomonadales bacterium]|nr:autotransporter-associated beta strand repeat-containing protein [Pseudomonadales bacterium]